MSKILYKLIFIINEVGNFFRKIGNFFRKIEISLKNLEKLSKVIIFKFQKFL